jgi:hypothetical protein
LERSFLEEATLQLWKKSIKDLVNLHVHVCEHGCWFVVMEIRRIEHRDLTSSSCHLWQFMWLWLVSTGVWTLVLTLYM